jgi:hypothetical protein
MREAAACEYCAGPTTLITELAPLGSHPGHRIYFCESCKRHTWTEWRITQQQQAEPKKDDSKE